MFLHDVLIPCVIQVLLLLEMFNFLLPLLQFLRPCVTYTWIYSKLRLTKSVVTVSSSRKVELYHSDCPHCETTTSLYIYPTGWHRNTVTETSCIILDTEKLFSQNVLFCVGVQRVAAPCSAGVSSFL